MASSIVSKMLRHPKGKGKDVRGGAYKKDENLASQESGQLKHTMYPKPHGTYPAHKRK